MVLVLLSEITEPSTDSAEIDLQMLLAITGLVTAISTLLTLVLTLSSRIADHPRPHMAFIPSDDRVVTSQRYNVPVTPTLLAQLSNVGTGEAHQISVIGVHCLVRLTNSAYAKSGFNQTIFEKGSSLNLEIIPSIQNWHQVGVLVTWSQTRLWRKNFKRCHWLIKLEHHYEHPAPAILTTDGGGGITVADSIDPKAPENQSLLAQSDKRLTLTDGIAIASPHWWVRRRQMKKLRNAGWEWQRVLPTVDPAQSDSPDDQENRS